VRRRETRTQFSSPLEAEDDANQKVKITDLHANEFAADLDFILAD
jgi:hypothetical protein